MNNGLTNEEELNRRRATAFCKEELMVHVVKKNGSWYNGIILIVREEFFTIEDREDGAKNVFFFELKNPIVEYEEEKEWVIL